MGKIVIRRRIELGFLGKGYEEAYLEFQSIPISDLEGVVKEVEPKEGEKDFSSVGKVLELLKRYFLEGKFPDKDGLADLAKEDLDGLDARTCTKCFEFLTGQDIEKKEETS